MECKLVVIVCSIMNFPRVSQALWGVELYIVKFMTWEK